VTSSQTATSQSALRI